MAHAVHCSSTPYPRVEVCRRDEQIDPDALRHLRLQDRLDTRGAQPRRDAPVRLGDRAAVRDLKRVRQTTLSEDWILQYTSKVSWIKHGARSAYYALVCFGTVY